MGKSGEDFEKTNVEFERSIRKSRMYNSYKKSSGFFYWPNMRNIHGIKIFIK